VTTTEGGWVGSVTIPSHRTRTPSTGDVADSRSITYCPDSEWIISALDADQVAQAANCCYIQASEKEKALKTCARHLAAEKGNKEQALSKLKATLEWRNSKEIAVSEFCNIQRGDDLADKMEIELGPHGRLCVRGRDKEGRAIMHCVTRFSRRDGIQDKCAYIQSHCLVFERAVAATERYQQRGNQQQSELIVAVDISEFAMWQIPSAELTKELIHMANAYYPERLHKVYVIDAPRLFRLFWMLVRPFLDPVSKAKYEFVTGQQERETILGSTIDADQAMPYMLSDGKLTDPWDVQRFLYDVDFDKTYDEK